MSTVNRRSFLGTATAAGLSLGLGAGGRADSPADKLVVAIIGTGGRGTSLAGTFEKQANTEVGFVCDVDKRRAAAAAAAVHKINGRPPKVVTDLRRVFDEKAVDAVVVATSNHWHAPAAIMACAAGKHVYVEKPCSHTPHEGELLVAAARKYKRHVQMGNQRRSRTSTREAMDDLKAGLIGRVYLARGWYGNTRPSIGTGTETAVPDWLDYDLWQGPAPRRPYRSNVIHYNWHWFWHWGNGELGNNGIHMLDLCRWGLGVEFPTRVTSTGGRYHWKDDQETPDTNVVCFDFHGADGGKSITWLGLSCNKHAEPDGAEVIFTGDKGTLVMTADGYTVLDRDDKQVKQVKGVVTDAEHTGNFLAAVRGGKPLNSEIEEGHKSTLLCHLGNIAYRTGRTLRCDPANGHILNDREAAGYWSREYAEGWEPRV